MPITSSVLNGHKNQINATAGTAAQAQAISDYYDYLTSESDYYGAIGKSVVNNTSGFGQYANDVLSAAGYGEQIGSVQKNLAINDIDRRLNHLDPQNPLGNGTGHLEPQEIAQNHYSTFDNMNIPRSAWGGSMFEEYVGSGSWVDIAQTGEIPAGNLSDALADFLRDKIVDVPDINGIDIGDAAGHLIDAIGVSGAGQVPYIIGMTADGLFTLGFENPGQALPRYGLGKLLDGIGKFMLPYLPDEGSTLPDAPLTPGDAAQEAADGAGAAGTLSSPLVLDLGGDGIEVKAIDEVNVFFNVDADPQLEEVGWVGANEGFLARDLNNNGQIDQINELFGNATTSGFDVLSQLDSNADGMITAADTDFASLRIWQDADIDGQTDAGELTTLAQRGITSIDLNYNPVDVWEKGNLITQDGTYTQNGVAHQIIDIWFNTGQFNTIDDPDAAGSTIDPETLLLPHSRGYGTIHSLAVAMTGNETLMDMVKDLADSAPADAAGWDAQVRAIMLEWADVTDYSTSRGMYVDKRELAFLEAFTGQAGQATPGYTAATQYEKAFAAFQSEMTDRLLATSALRDIFSDAQYDYATDTLLLGDLTTILDNMTASTVANNDAYWTHALKLLAARMDQFGPVTQSEVALLQDLADEHMDNPESLGFTLYNGQILFDYYDGTILQGTVAADTLFGGTGNDVVNGLSGSDVIFGSEGNDQLTGNSGNDLMAGGVGNDQYLFIANQGNDTITTQGSNGTYHDVIVFTDATTAADVTFAHVGNNLVLTHAQGGVITIEEALGSVGSGLYQDAKEIRFADGTSIDLTSGLPFTGTAAADYMHGTSHNDLLYGLAGNDVLWGEAGNDTLFGGAGSDSLYGDAGADTFHIENIGASTTDTIADFSLTGGEVIDITDLHVSEFNKLLISDQSGNAQVLFNNGQKLLLTGISAASLAESHFTGFTHIAEVDQTLTGGASDDSMYGGDANDVLYGLAGNDTLNGGGGSNTLVGGVGNDSLVGGVSGDVYQFQAGDGLDTISDTNGTNHISFTDGIRIQNISLDKSGNDLLVNYGSGNQITVKDMYSSGGTNQGYVSDIQFNNSTSLVLTNVFVSKGAANADSLLGGANNDVQYGLAGNDTLRGGNGDDTLIGGAGDDTMKGESGYDNYRVAAGEGNDTITADTNDILAYTDNTTLANLTFVRSAQDLIVTHASGGSIKVASAFGSSGHTLSACFSKVQFSDGTEIDLTQGLPLTGTAQADTLLRGSAGNDIIYGLAGNDTLQGLEGNNTLVGGADNDSMNAGFGNDVYRTSATEGNDTISADSGGTNVIGYTDATVASNITLFRSGQNLVITNSLGGSMTLTNAFGTSGQIYNGMISSLQFADNTTLDLSQGLVFTGTASADNVRGSSGNDKLYALGGNDTLQGMDGNDTFYGGLGSDTFTGGNGTDIYVMTPSSSADTDVINDFSLADNERIDVTELSIAAYSNLTIGTVSGSAQITFTDGQKLKLTGVNASSLNETYFTGFTGPNLTLTGGESTNDSLSGAAAHDSISGLGGNDTLIGGAGNDTLIGGTGNDLLTGGTGSDTFAFASGYGQDTISGFVHGTDKLQFTASGLGVTTAEDVTSHASVSGSDTLITFGTDVISLVGITNLTSSDIIIV